MKSKCSFILKASLALVLALVMLFGTVATSVAAVVEDDLADTGADVDIVDKGADVDIADEGADVDLVETGADVPYLRYMQNMPSHYYDGNTSAVMTQSSNNSNKWYKVLTLSANSSYGFFIRMNDSNTSCWKTGNTTVESGQEVELVSYGGANGNSSNRVTYNTGSATSYVFTYDTSNHKISVAPTTTSTVKMAYDIASGHDGDYNLNNYVTMSHLSDGVYKYDFTSNLSTSKYYMFIQTNSDRYHKAASTLTENTGVVTVYDYGTNNWGDSGDKINFTPSAATKYRFTFDIKDKTVKMLRLYTVSYNKGNNPTGVSSISGTAPTAQTKVYGTNLTLETNAFTVSQGYTQDGWTTTNGGTTKNYNSGGSYTSNSGTTLYPYWKETTSVVTFQRKLGDAAATQLTTKNSGIKTAATYTAPAVDGYTFAGWSTTSTLSSDTYAYTATLNDPSVTAISVNAKSAITLVANYTENKSGVSLDAYTNGELSLAGGSLTIDGSTGTAQNVIQVGTATKVTAVSTPGSGYSFLGWTKEGSDASHVGLYTNSGCTAAYTSGATGTIYIKTDGTLGANPDVTIKAHFQSSAAKYITVYNNTMYDRQHWVVVSSPPQTVKVTNPVGTVKTYKYGAGTKAQRGEDQTTSGSPSTRNIVNTNNATYYEGNLLEVHEGDKVELIYSALASSDIITGVFYNNTIRYTTEKEGDNLFYKRTYREGGYGSEDDGYIGIPEGEVPDDDVDFDYHDDTDHASASETGGFALYANKYYYNTELAEVIAAQNYTATVDQDTHTVTWTVGNQDYFNIDMELNSKKEIHFSDTVNAKINEVHTDNYYAVGEDVSPSTTETGSLSIKAAGNSTQTNTITKANIKFYYCNNMGEYINPVNGKVVSKANRVELKEGDATLTVVGSAASISNSGTDPSTNFYYIDGPMPATDVMVDLDITATYSLKMYSVIRSDTSSSPKTAFYQVADLTLGTKHTKNTTADTSTQVGTASCVSGQGITLKAENISSGYMFVGWYLGTDSAPDYSKPISSADTFSYKPTSSVTIWAVGTKDLYINGAAELFKVNNDWQADGTGTAHGNLKMSFDPSLGTQGKYYYEISETVFAAASRSYVTYDRGKKANASNNIGYYQGDDDNYYWDSSSDSNHGNAFFQFLDTASGNTSSNKTVWSKIACFKTTATDSNSRQNKIKYGKVYAYGSGSDIEGNGKPNGQGFINFDETTYAGYSAPIRIYYDPANSGTFTVEPTPVYPHIYVSNGYKGLDVTNTGTPSEVTIQVGNNTSAGNNTTSSSPENTKMTFNGSGWDPWYEGHVSDITVKARNATLTLTKTTASADYKVSNFIVYNMTKGTVKAHAATATATTNQYTCNTIKTSDDDRLYIVPVLEYCGDAAKITINVDSTKLDYKKWGKLVSCYAWGSEGDTCGAYPGQLMVPSDDGGSWTATFKAPNSLTGILFANYVDSGNGPNNATPSKGYTFISMSGIMGNVTYSGSGDDASNKRIVTIDHSDYVTQYNKISSGDYDKYTMANCKVQTYDYREPIAYLKNKPAGASNTTLTFALKDGNSNLLSRSHAQLKDVNILTLASTSNPSTPYTWSALKWEYLTDSSGDYYTDLNGFKLPEKPTASFYIAAKGMVRYKDNSMNTVFKTGKEYDSVTGVNYNDYYGKVDGEIDMNYAVQWYVYDAAGNYITDVLSAGFADKTDEGTDSTNYSTAMTVVTQRLLDLGYAVEGRSVKICYDKPRYCYWNKTDTAPYINNGTDFNVYRFTGQWYEDNEYRTAKVYAKVGIKTDNGVDVAEASSAAYGSASVEVDGSKCSIAGYSGTNTEGDVDYGYTTIIDGDSGALSLKASSQNFVGWYHYVTTYDSSDIESSDTTQELVFDTADPVYKPNYSKDVTYIAIYKAKVNYRYKYVGREGGTKYYNVPGSTDDNEDNMSAAEIANGNKVATDSTHMTNATANVPGGAGISIFKKNINFNGTLTTSMFSNELEYVLTVNNSSKSDPTYTVTAKYRDSTGAIKDKAVSKQYNQVIDLTVENSGTALTNQWAGHNFIGWYEYNTSTSTYGNLLSTQANYGLVCTKTQTIIAVYSGDGSGKTGPVGNDTWEVFVDDHGPTYEKTSSTTGDVYCDAIVRVRMNNSNLTTLDEGGRVGMLIVDDNGSNQTINTSKLANYAIALRASNGKSGNVKVGDYTLSVTNLFSTSVNRFGRVDLAAKYSYGNVTGQKYHIYAYYFKGGDATDASNYIFSTTTGYATGTYS